MLKGTHICLNMIKICFSFLASGKITTEDLCHILKNIGFFSLLPIVFSSPFSLFQTCESFLPRCSGLMYALWQKAVYAWKTLPSLLVVPSLTYKCPSLRCNLGCESPSRGPSYKIWKSSLPTRRATVWFTHCSSNHNERSMALRSFQPL